MGISISGSNAISGLGGQDTDFDKVLSQLKKIESTQLNRLEAWKSDWNLRYEAFTQIIDQVQAASNMLSQLSDRNNFVKKLVQSSNDNILTAVANASAQDVQHTVKVYQTASNAIWANAHVYDSKTDIINTTGKDAYFNYSYAGKEYQFKVPANTTLDSFTSMFNNSADNPGLKISLIQTGKGYVFQVAGKETGAANDLIIHDSDLVGMRAEGTKSTWLSNEALKPGESVIDPNTYVFDLVLRDGSKKSVTVKGNATADELCAKLEGAAGGIKAKVDASGNLTLEGVKSFSKRLESEDPYTPASTKFTILGGLVDKDGKQVKLNDTAGGIAQGLADDAMLTFTATLDDGSTREISVKAGATKRELLIALAQATQDGADMQVDTTGDGHCVTLAGVKELKLDSDSVPDPEAAAKFFRTEEIESKGENHTLGMNITSAKTTLTFDSAKLEGRIDGKTDTDPQDLVFTIVKQDGTAKNIYISSDKSNADLMAQIKDELGDDCTIDGDKLSMEGVKEFKVSSGAVAKPAWESSLKVTASVPASTGDPENSLFHQDSETGDYVLEEAPELKFTFKTNDGTVGTLQMRSGSSMKEILQAIQNPSDPRWSGKWSWTDKEGNASAAPADWNVTFVDADGNEVPSPGTDPVYLQVKNVQAVSGPQIAGQIASSDNWSIQRAANARYQIDNWPVEMESATNSISDAIEGVVFNLQDVGEARISVSTDITSVEQSIQNFLDAVNSVILTVNDLMKYDENKEVTSNDPNDIGSDNYSPSGLTNQKGGLLMGNYGVQLFKSRFSSQVTATPPGFKSRQNASDVLSGDVLASLANLGIKTDTDSTSSTYGLLTIAPSSSIAAMQSMDKENYTNMINNNLEAVVDFFCATGTGSSSSTDFRYGSHVAGITTAGSYEVKYRVLEDGTITDVTVGGEPAKQDFSQPGNYFSVASGDPRGLSILIDDLTLGDHPPAGSEPMYVNIKQGLIQSTNDFLKAELVFNDVSIGTNDTKDQIADAISLKSKNGALMSLRDNYKTVMEGIDAKIEREQRRLSTWESRQKAIFANLETLLKQYDEQQTSLEAQLNQLSSNK